jgi:hypothetical protein
MRFFYTGTDAFQYLTNLSSARSTLYFHHELLDLLFLSGYTALFVFGLEAVFPENLRLKWLGLIPGLFDFVETAGILLSIKRELSPGALSYLGYATAIKWTTDYGVFFLLCGGLVLKVSKKFRSRALEKSY